MKPKTKYTTTLFGKLLYDQVIPPNDPLRLLKGALNWNMVRKILETDTEGLALVYSDSGRPALDPLIIFKLLILQRWHPASDRKVIERANSDIRYRFFLDLPIPEKIPDFTNLSKFRSRWGEQLFANLFKAVFQQIQAYGFADVSKGVVGDITHSISPVQVLTARNLISEIFIRYLDKLTLLITEFSHDFVSEELSPLIAMYHAWYDEYSAQIRLGELTKENRFDMLLREVFKLRYLIEQRISDPIPAHILTSKEWIGFEDIQDLLNTVLKENVTEVKVSANQDHEEKQKEITRLKTTKKAKPKTSSTYDNLTPKEIQQILYSSDKNTDSPPKTYPEGSFKQKKGKRTIISPVDPELRKGCKHTQKFFNGTKIAVTMTDDDFLASVHTVQGNLADKTQTVAMITQTLANSGQIPDYISLDKGFDYPDIRKKIHDFGIQSGIDFKKVVNPKNKGKYTKEAFHFDLDTMTVTCPADIKTQEYTKNATTENFVFNFPIVACEGCKLKNQCTNSSTGRTVSFSFHYRLLLEDKDFLTTLLYEKSRKKRWNLESRFGNGKRSHNLGYTPYRGTKKSGIHHKLVGIVLNCKKLIKKLYFPSNPSFKTPSASGAST